MAENSKEKLENEIEKDQKQEVEEVKSNQAEDETIPLDPELGIDPEQLNTELEGLKDLVQGEISKMMDENPDAEWKDIVHAARNEKISAKSKPKGPICECCGENVVGENGIYCDDCLETMKHYPFEWWKFIIPVIVIVLLVLSFSFFAISWPVYKESVEADHLVQQHKLMSALNKYDAINTEIKVTDDNYGTKYLRRQVKVYDTIGIDSYEELDKFIDSYYTGTIIDRPTNKYVKSVKNKITSYSKAYECFTTAAQEKTYKEFLTAYEKEVDGTDLNKAIVAYYKYYASLMYGETPEVQKKNIDAIRSADKDMACLYLPLYTEVCLNDKDYDGVLKYASELEKVNSESTYVYLYRSVAYRLKGNINMAYTSCAKGIKISSTDPLLNYQMSIINLLEGKTKEAKNYASIAHENANTQSSYMSSASMYALCAKLTNDDDTYNSIISEMESYSYTISPDVQKILDGSLKIEDVFTTGKGDLSWE